MIAQEYMEMLTQVASYAQKKVSHIKFIHDVKHVIISIYYLDHLFTLRGTGYQRNDS